ncbi:hypothetical protein ASF37_13915 [Aeromicrobium sp. Leaf289]|nr:hypothetical protein ASF05_06925 [Aeromicrobium sp. Leaf245]KQP26362.1 hypothetical protein ASF38_12180 [Aeromicrobium sp. Leaf272]KQP76032.1 hypothetical protein ASF37_13915 [Aeromicrobium sp. Leaf289]KQP85059.1 hypothetical protein ASF35_09595 [Aeromicrobium sp. Leaf291]
MPYEMCPRCRSGLQAIARAYRVSVGPRTDGRTRSPDAVAYRTLLTTAWPAVGCSSSVGPASGVAETAKAAAARVQQTPG